MVPNSKTKVSTYLLYIMCRNKKCMESPGKIKINNNDKRIEAIKKLKMGKEMREDRINQYNTTCWGRHCKYYETVGMEVGKGSK